MSVGAFEWRVGQDHALHEVLAGGQLLQRRHGETESRGIDGGDITGAHGRDVDPEKRFAVAVGARLLSRLTAIGARKEYEGATGDRAGSDRRVEAELHALRRGRCREAGDAGREYRGAKGEAKHRHGQC